ncbi:MAG: PH domain-containing protein [Bowdeniella nasicola]|nr:PH domain-containing protein [Bowdeniella nasicola]
MPEPARTTGATPFEPEGIEFTPVSSKLTQARFIIAGIVAVPALIAFLVLALLASPWWWIGVAGVVLVIVWLGWLIPRQVRALGYAEAADDLVIRRGIMFRSLTIVPYGRMQYVDVSEGPIARMFSIASIELHTASASTDATLDGLPRSEASRLRDRLTARGETQLAGL